VADKFRRINSGVVLNMHAYFLKYSQDYSTSQTISCQSRREMKVQMKGCPSATAANGSNGDGSSKENVRIINARNVGWGVYTGAKNEREWSSPDLISLTDYLPDDGIRCCSTTRKRRLFELLLSLSASLLIVHISLLTSFSHAYPREQHTSFIYRN